MQASYVEIRIILECIYFPLTKKELIQQAIKHGASNKVIEDLKSIPDKEYTSRIYVFKELEVKNQPPLAV
jgi:hypothetical protein